MILTEINWNQSLSITVIGYSVVLLALTFLFGVYMLIPLIIDAVNKYKLRRQGRHECAQKNSLDITGEESAAIAAALYYFLNEQHDIESGKITIKKISRRYTPWSSKIYSMNNLNRQL